MLLFAGLLLSQTHTRAGGSASVHPVHWDPLGLTAQCVHGRLQRLKGFVQVVVDDGQVEVVVVRPLDPGALVHGLP